MNVSFDYERRPVLLVEDNCDLRDGLSEVLESCGVRVTAARDGIEALDLLQAGLRPAAVLLDLTLPGLDGREVLAAMQADPGLAPIPVVWMSADPRQPPTSVWAHLEKPFKMEDLIAVLGSLSEA